VSDSPFGDDEDRIFDAEDAADWELHPDPRYLGELEMQARDYEDQIWDQILRNPEPATKEGSSSRCQTV